MAIELPDDLEKQLIESIKRFADEVLDEDMGDLRARQVLDFCLREIAPSVYNQAIRDARAWLEGRVEDLEGSCWQPELDYWSERR